MIVALRAELSFLARMVATMLAIVGTVLVAAVVGKWLHLPVLLTAAVAFLGLAAVGYLAVWWWLERLHADRRNGVMPRAFSSPRYAPIVVQGLIFAFQAALFVYQVFDRTVTGRRTGADLAIVLAFSMALTAYSVWKSARGVRGAAFDLGTASESSRLRAYREALALPDDEQRRDALRPIRVRGAMRLGLTAASIASMFALVPFLGVGWALVVSFVFFASVIAIGVRFFDL